ncbi:MAG TPA: hypothetical protein VN577_14875 [Terriglobales bacterium]|nr:hypothetical protein [Terriglobales bacterium]
MKVVSFVAALILCIALPTSAQTSSFAVQPKIVIMESEDVKGQLSLKRMNNCLLRLAREWKVKYELLPTIFVFHVSEEIASAALISDELAVRENRSPRKGDSYYEVWIVGKPKLNSDMVAFENILEDFFQLQVTKEQREQVMTKVGRLQNATVDAYQGN